MLRSVMLVILDLVASVGEFARNIAILRNDASAQVVVVFCMERRRHFLIDKQSSLTEYVLNVVYRLDRAHAGFIRSQLRRQTM